MSEPTPESLHEFLAAHESVAKPKLLAVGALVGEWRVAAYLGSGGNAEVYRVVRDDGTSGALKILLRDDAASKKRFRQEAALLSAQMGPSFAKFYAADDIAGRPYLITELLEPVELPQDEREIAAYLLSICKAAGLLHRSGLIHRDIKPSNIMRRSNGELVLIDLGLVKDTKKSSDPERDVSIVAGKAIAVGTPRYAAPEQMMGGEITAATDVHAIGRLADVAFGTKMPRVWLPIIRRATSSIPEQRYQAVEALAHAIRHRNRSRRWAIAASIAFVVAIGGMVANGLVGRAIPHASQPRPNAVLVDNRLPKSEDVAICQEEDDWSSLCQPITTNVVSRELVWERLVTNTFAGVHYVTPERAYREVTNQVAAIFINLNHATNTFDAPITLAANHTYFVEGPGVISADFRTSGPNVVVHIKNCFFFNRSTTPLDQAGIRYVFDRGACLNFINLDQPPPAIVRACIEDFDGAFNVLDFRDTKNLHSSRHISDTRGKYMVEDMEDSIYAKYNIDPNRIPTDAELELVARCFRVPIDEAQAIRSFRKSRVGFACQQTLNKEKNV